MCMNSCPEEVGLAHKIMSDFDKAFTDPGDHTDEMAKIIAENILPLIVERDACKRDTELVNFLELIGVYEIETGEGETITLTDDLGHYSGFREEALACMDHYGPAQVAQT